MKIAISILVVTAVLAIVAGCATNKTPADDNSGANNDPFALDMDALGWTSDQPDDQTTTADQPFEYKGMPLAGLRKLAEAKGLEIGTALNFKYLSNAKYSSVAGQEFNVFTPENEMKWQTIQGTQSTYDWFFADEFLKFAQKNNMKVRGHTLVWHNQLPRWVTEAAKTKADLLAIVSDHVRTIVNHYKGKIYKWDVVNEVVDDKAGMRSSVFYDLSGTDFIETAFREARAADPAALLYINDYSVEDINPKSDRLYALVKDMLKKGVPIDGVGLQSHWVLEQLPSIDSVRANIQRFTDLGLRVDITELDIRMKGKPDLEKLKAQGEAYGRLVKLILELPKTDTITVWGFDDAHSWVRSSMPGYGAATILDENYGAKPAYEAIYQALGGK